MAIAACIGQPDVELGARAGQASRRSLWARGRWRRMRCAGFANVETRPEWWFQAEISSTRSASVSRPSEATTARAAAALRRGHLGRPARRLSGRISVAECAPSLRGAVAPLTALIDQLLEVDAFGLTAPASA
jgi:hypothetical protein